MTFRDAVDYLSTFVNFERRPQPQAMRQVRLERMQELCRRLGDCHRQFRSVLVTGTNGKGSICAMLYSMLRAGRLRVGLYTSPHLESVRERIRVSTPQCRQYGHGEDWISESDFAVVIADMHPVLEQMRVSWPEGAPTYFEVMTAAALLYFQQQHVDIAVLEIGLGGRLDATNVVEQSVSVIGPIDVDHADVLGPDPVTIAREKAGIIKRGQSVITAPQRGDVLALLRSVCDEQAVPLIVCGEDLTARVTEHSLSGITCSVTGLRGIYEGLTLPLLGRHQAQNAAVAIGTLESLSSRGIPHAMVEEGLKRVVCPGRFELLQKSPLVILDGGHNPQAAGALRQTLEELCAGRRVHLLIGMSLDKSVEGVMQRLVGLPLTATCTMSRHPRALNPVALAKRLSVFCSDVHVMSDPADAYTYLVNAVAPSDVIVVMGSFFLVGELRTALRRSHVTARLAKRHELAAAV